MDRTDNRDECRPELVGYVQEDGGVRIKYHLMFGTRSRIFNLKCQR